MRRFWIIAAAPLLALPAVGHAQDAVNAGDDESDGVAAGPFEIDAEVGVHTDYRFRGISLSDKDPEVTAELSVSHESGLYAGVWASNVALDGKADDVELDLYAGFSPDVGAVGFDIGAVYYLYPGNSDFNYAELLASASTSLGPAEVTAGIAYAPSQDALGDEDNTYIYVSADVGIPATALSVHGTFGIEDGAFADNKKDWLIGVSYELPFGLTATVDYVDTARSFTPLGDATVVGRLSYAF